MLDRSVVSGYPPFPAVAPGRHDASTIPLLTDQLVRLGVAGSDARLLASAVGAHHGHPICSTDLRKVYCSVKRLDPVWHEAHTQLFSQLVEGVDADGLPALPPEGATRSAFLQWLMGLTTVADWIGSSEALCRWDRLDQWGGHPSSWFTESQRLAATALAKVGLDAAGLRTVNSGAEAITLALGNKMKPRPLQQAMAQILDQLDDEPCLVVIEAPMGEGKTEAGFSCTPGRRGLYVAMPTQATSNALFTRMSQFLERAADGKTQCALAHGAGGPAAATNRLQDVGLGTPDSAVTAGWWFRGSKRSLLCPQGIGTVDQALIGVLNARHGFVRLFGLSGRTVILDEVHAYDAYTGGLIERLVNWLQQLGCRVVLMSATLPSERRDAILRAWAGEVTLPQSTTYPRISWASPGSIKSLSFSASRHQKVQVQGIDPDEVATRAMDMAKAGARVLLVMNTVGRAQSLYRKINGVNRSLFHSRFPMSQRLTIGDSVLKKFGHDGNAQAGHVLVATQVAEQSLDIDMDVLITDPAPIDLVLQRSGRIHRHDRPRPQGFEQPLVLISGLDQQVPPEKLSTVYDRWIVLRSHAWLKGHSVLELPGDIDQAVQQVYGDTWNPAAPDQLLRELNDSRQKHETRQENMAQQARDATLAKPQDWDISKKVQEIDDDAAESGDNQFGTRLGKRALSVVPVFPSDLTSLTDPASTLAENWLRISHQGLIRAICNAQLPKQLPKLWSECSGLAHHHPLLLDDDGIFQADGVTARLDPDLGLVID